MSLKKVACVAAVISLAMAGTAFAGTWKAGDGENQNKWWYDNGNGSYPTNGWQWIDGNGDGVAESYYFDNSGWLLTNTTTPDGYTVNAEGAWVQNGTIQTKVVNQTVETSNMNANPADYMGNYEYSGAVSYIYNEKTRNYDLFAVTDNSSWEEWAGKIYPGDPAYFDFSIKKATEDEFKIIGGEFSSGLHVMKYDEEWFYDLNGNDELDEEEMDWKRDISNSYFYPDIEFLEDGRIAMNSEITLNYTEEDDVNTHYGWPAKGILKITSFYTKK